MTREIRTRDHRRLEAEQAVVAAVQRVLFDPKRVHSIEILRDLMQTPETPEALTGWARSYGLEAPCLIEAAKTLWRDGWEGDRRGMPEWPKWHQRMQELSDRLPAWRSYVARKLIATVEEALRMKRRALQPLEADLETMRAGLPETADDVRAIESEIARLHRFYDEEVPAARAKETERAKEWALRPQIFDPTAESWAEGEQRWRDHCRAMAEEAQRHGATLIPRRAPDLELAVNRAIAFQIDGRSYREIGATEQSLVSADVVGKSIRSLADLVGWNLRVFRQGRRRHSPGRPSAPKRAR